jgi:hypothetical protein
MYMRLYQPPKERPTSHVQGIRELQSLVEAACFAFPQRETPASAT